MMDRCLKGVTQKRNEHLHSRIWRICLKHHNATKRMVDSATAIAINTHNVGYVASHLADHVVTEWTMSMMKYLTAKDKKMNDESPLQEDEEQETSRTSARVLIR